ncbi:helix-turn-helix domain-containing protein [Gemmobacter aquatilis]|uniref:helix-turn-helix domain-containing protein n=1 Tax=Gemmobacter aquatilis TaxID=933059 RepID=UPI00158718BC
MTPDEAAALLRVSTKTLRRLRDKGLPYVMLTSGTIRYKPEDLTSFIAGRTQQCHSAPKARASGTTTSRSGVVEFMALAGPRTSRKPRA